MASDELYVEVRKLDLVNISHRGRGIYAFVHPLVALTFLSALLRRRACFLFLLGPEGKEGGKCPREPWVVFPAEIKVLERVGTGRSSKEKCPLPLLRDFLPPS